MAPTLTHDPCPALPTRQEWDTLMEMARALVQSGFLPSGVATLEKAATVILKGRELGIPPMQSLAHLHPIGGKLTCSAELMLALLARAGITWEWEKDGTDGPEAIILFHRHGFAPVTGRFTLEDAQRIQVTEARNGSRQTVRLADQEAWQNYPANLLRARAISNGARMIGPDYLAGMSYTPEELGAQVDEEGRPIVVPEPASGPTPSAMSRGNGNGNGPPDRPVDRFLRRCAALRQELGDEIYGAVLTEHDVQDAEGVPPEDTATMKALIEALLARSVPVGQRG